MSEQHYDIFFRGEVLDGFELDAVKMHVGQLFKAPPEKVEQLFSGKVVPLKKALDKVTAAKFKQALEKAGAKIYIKLAADAVAATSRQTPAQNQARPAPASQGQPIPVPAAVVIDTVAEQNTPAAARVATEVDFVILPPGSDVLRADERPVIETIKVDTSGIKMASVFDQPVMDKTPPPPAPDVSHLSTAAVGADILAGVKKEPPPPPPAVDHISIAEGGFDLSQLVEKAPVPPAPDVSHISTAAVGADILEGVAKKPVPPAPDVSHIRLTP